MAYRIGFPGWKLAARAGFEMSFRVDVCHDPEAGVYVATSPDLAGLVTEAVTLDELQAESLTAAQHLLSIALSGRTPRASTRFVLRSRIPAAA